MVRTHQTSHSVFRSILTRHGNLKAEKDTGVFYIGLGDQFDDERRLVREETSELRPATRPTWAGAGRPPPGSNRLTSLRSALAVFARFGWRRRNRKPTDG